MAESINPEMCVIRTYAIISLLWIALLFFDYLFKWSVILENETQEFFQFYLISLFGNWFWFQLGITAVSLLLYWVVKRFFIK